LLNALQTENISKIQLIELAIPAVLIV
jgi:hypothetical protein